MTRKSTIGELDTSIQAEVHAAIKRGLSIDAIVQMLKGLGAPVSRSSVGRYTKNFAELAKQQRDMRAVAEAFGKEFGDADDNQGRMMIQLLTSVCTRVIMPLATDDEVTLDGQELHFLARAVKDATSAAKIDVDREAKIRDEAGKRAKIAAADAADTAGRAAGASPETLARIRAGILGIAA